MNAESEEDVCSSEPSPNLSPSPHVQMDFRAQDPPVSALIPAPAESSAVATPVVPCVLSLTMVPRVTEVQHALASTSVPTDPCGVASTAVPHVMTSTSLSTVPVANSTTSGGHNHSRTTCSCFNLIPCKQISMLNNRSDAKVCSRYPWMAKKDCFLF